MTITMMAKVLKTLDRDDLDRIAFALELVPDAVNRDDIEYALQRTERQGELARIVGLMVYRALQKELKQ